MIPRAPFPALLAAALLAACSTGSEEERPAPPEPTGISGPAAEADKTPKATSTGFLSEENQRVVLLFFPGEDGETLLPEERVIFLTNTLSSQVKQAVSELLRGPEEEALIAAFPRNTRLLAVFLLEDGTAFIDLGSEAQAIPAGSAAELSAIYALIDTIVFNFSEIQRVQILIEGQEVATLAGHVAIARPLRADLQRIDWTWMPEAEKLLQLDQTPPAAPDPLPAPPAVPEPV